MEVKIGVQNVGRELVIESAQTPDQVAELVEKAIAGEGGLLTLVDEKGRRVVVPAAKLAYVEIAAQEVRRVGFGAI
ncbi:MAG: DUF3107 domain-containing protein [Frankia sp.]|nr:DUF3107 domain-containing protein [Frankia sp.]